MIKKKKWDKKKVVYYILEMSYMYVYVYYKNIDIVLKYCVGKIWKMIKGLWGFYFVNEI